MEFEARLVKEREELRRQEQDEKERHEKKEKDA